MRTKKRKSYKMNLENEEYEEREFIEYAKFKQGLNERDNPQKEQESESEEFILFII